MGPRPDGRGKPEPARLPESSSGASMGPRPDGRGKLRPPSAPCPSPMPASMGPRPDGRGKRRCAARSGRCAPWRQWGRGQTAAESSRRRCALAVGYNCVNGAAARRPRKVLRRDAPKGVKLGVNGAAARRPRKDPGVDAAIAQIGRQWGRGQTAAERFAAATTDGVRIRRQWGRGQTAAERSCASASRAGQPGVNGAAARRPRKGSRRRRYRRRRPSVNGAAARRPRKAERGDCGMCAGRDASMGPRPDGRGKERRRSQT